MYTNLRYGCNEVLPRRFDEIHSLYSTDMLGVFSGGLVYEFTQEPNNYGLVKLDSAGNVALLPDFFTLKKQLEKVNSADQQFIQASMRSNMRKVKLRNKLHTNAFQPQCQNLYQSLDISRGPSQTLQTDYSKALVTPGKFVKLLASDLRSQFVVTGVSGEVYKPVMEVVQVLKVDQDVQQLSNGTYEVEPDVDTDYGYYDESEELASESILEAIHQVALVVTSWCRSLFEAQN